jgi:hypothetical protein
MRKLDEIWICFSLNLFNRRFAELMVLKRTPSFEMKIKNLIIFDLIFFNPEA